MSELEKTKKEMIEILERIPGSGSFEGAELATRVAELMDQYNALADQQAKNGATHTVTPAPEVAPG